MQMLTADPITISCYENHVPTFVDSAMDSLYQSVFSSLSLFRVYGSVECVNTYVVRDAGAVIAVFLFRFERSKVVVCNEVMKVSAIEIARFAKYIFTRFARVSVITFRAVETDVRRLPYPFQRFNTLEDIVLTLPATVDAYIADLGKATRRTIRGYMNRLVRAYPSFRFEVFETADIRERDVMSIIQMNQARMADKHKVSAYHDAEARRIFQLARVCGLVGVLLLDERVCAGAVSFRTGSNYFMTLAAHDPQFDAFRLGTLNGFLNISECIKRGGKECHLLWGRHEYKYRFLGVQRELDNLAVYRSGLKMLRHADLALKMAFEGVARLAYCRMHEEKRNNTLAWRVASLAVGGWRSLKRIGKAGTPPKLQVSEELPEQ